MPQVQSWDDTAFSKGFNPVVLVSKHNVRVVHVLDKWSIADSGGLYC
jgi:hypothetical protein